MSSPPQAVGVPGDEGGVVSYLHAAVVNDHGLELNVWVELGDLLTLTKEETIRELPEGSHTQRQSFHRAQKHRNDPPPLT